MTSSSGIHFGGMLRHGREVGGPALRKLTFHDRARMVKALGLAIMARKEELQRLDHLTGATRKDGWIDIEGGAGRSSPSRPRAGENCRMRMSCSMASSKGCRKRHLRRPAHVHAAAGCGRAHQRLQLPRLGTLEKLAPTLLAGVPAIVKPASATAYLTEAAFKIMIEANVLPPGGSS